jgi:hypothetical protein
VFDPEADSDVSGVWICEYRVSQFTATPRKAQGANPLQALEHALFSIRVILHTNSEEWELRSTSGQNLFFNYGQVFGPQP